MQIPEASRDWDWTGTGTGLRLGLGLDWDWDWSLVLAISTLAVDLPSSTEPAGVHSYFFRFDHWSVEFDIHRAQMSKTRLKLQLHNTREYHTHYAPSRPSSYRSFRVAGCLLH
ncbi:hypothetical protein GJ744_000707 [Endocarpon pusillum]|uniref:Uncharacterized protein n=1 Tax=Endocarpon pusillum TaxID=364733 RepID=A0A8H7AAE8_9EURO|nr:hypothetical protein GJ744_000707 [Endocarpon pusillum]